MTQRVSVGFWTPLFLSFDMIINLHLVEFKQRLFCLRQGSDKKGNGK